jgi:glycine betaine/proline transport system permease protein
MEEEESIPSLSDLIKGLQDATDDFLNGAEDSIEPIRNFNEDMLEFFQVYPLGENLGDWVTGIVNWLVVQANWLFMLIRWPIDLVLSLSEMFLLAIPWPVIVIVFFVIGFLRSGWVVGAIGGGGLIIVGFLGFWDETMTTLSMIVTALVFCVVVGVPLGIMAARSDRFEGFLRPVLDAMQTIHPFVYLIPIVMFFSIGKVPGTIATIFFALPPMIRLTNLGIRQVPHDVVEAGRAFGSDDTQLLFDVQIPLALPTIMAGLNQTIMLALSMVVIVALIAGGGLGQVIYGAVSSMQVGRAVTSGIAVLVLAIVLDRVSQVKGRKIPT